jgi:AAA+ superfamily predicted ATPase
MAGEEAIAGLRAAVALSPDNQPLVRHFVETLLGFGRSEEAEVEIRKAVTRWPNDVALKLNLATAFQQQGKTSHALVVTEELCNQPQPTSKALILMAKLLNEQGDKQRAETFYKRAVAGDPSASDPILAEELGVPAIAAPSASYVDDDDRIRVPVNGPESAPEIDVERPRVNFSDVGGMDAVKDEIGMKIIYPLQHPDLYKAYGKSIGGGILLYGPPGCGKTYLARATAGQIKAGFVSIGINDVLDMWMGNSERNLHEIFEQARRNKPCVLFFDEVDALAASRTDLRQSAGRQVINQFLAELDGVQSTNDGILILAATNAPWHLDAAFRRPGRFDRIIFVPPPDTGARAGILRVLVKDKPVDNLDFAAVAKKTPDFSGADLKAIIDQAIEAKLKQAMRDGVPKPLTTKDLLASAASIKPSTKEWFSSAKNYAMYANQGGAYDDVLKYLDGR